MHIELLDDCAFPWQGAAVTPCSVSPEDNLDRWFWTWAREHRARLYALTRGIFLINANGRFTSGAHRQDLQGMEVLKHIRVTPWLGSIATWHAIVYSFEPLDDILARKPGDLILTSPGVTFLRLPVTDRDISARCSHIDPPPEPCFYGVNLDGPPGRLRV